jgi:hypothetical protein
MQAQINVASVMAYYQLVTTFGNIPYSEALDAETPSPSHDGQVEIYNDLMSRLNTAISNLDASVAGFSASSELHLMSSMAAM